MSANSNHKTKVSRVDLKITPEQKELLERAAALKGLSLSDYMLSHCLEAAREDIATHQRLVLSDRDRDLFLSLMENPPQPGDKLTTAMQAFQEEYETENQCSSYPCATSQKTLQKL